MKLDATLMHVLGFSGLANSISFKRREFPGLSEREYNVAQGLDAAAALVGAADLIAAAAEERFNRKKASNEFPTQAIRFCLDRAKLKISDVDFIAHGFSYEPHRAVIEADDYGARQYQEVFAPEIQKQLFATHFGEADWDTKFVSVPHHLAHAASSFYPSGFEESLILISDGMGEISSMTVAVGKGNDITQLAQVPAFHSLGTLYGVFTLYLGFYMNSDEYKVMGLAPYGNPRRYFDQIMEFVSLRNDGTYTIPLFAHNRTLLERETHRGVLAFLTEKFGPSRQPEAEITQTHKDLAAALQSVLQTTQLHVLRHFKRQTALKNLCLAGGVALNCSANGVIRRSELFDNVFVQPAAGDDGTALGAALYAQRMLDPDFKSRKMTVPLWGPDYSSQDITAALEGRTDVQVIASGSFTEVCKEVALRINRGEIIGWFQDRMEFGPRALGSRSILADPRDAGMRERINALVKKREGFRPFAPVVTAERAAEIFEIQPGKEDTFSHMLYVTHVRAAFRDKLPATTHVDGSARAQTVSEQQNPRLWQLLNAFADLSGLPVLLNTSFNVRGQPIVCSPTEAIDTFLAARLDALVLGDTILIPGKVEKAGVSKSRISRRELEEAASRHEEFWVNRLSSLQPVSLPHERKEMARGPKVGRALASPARSPSAPLEPTTTGQLESIRQDCGALRTARPTFAGRHPEQEDILAAFATFVARLTGASIFDMLLGDGSLSEGIGDLATTFATWLPMNFDIGSERSWQDVCASVRTELRKVRDHSTYALDVVARHPALQGQEDARLPLAVHFSKLSEDCALAPGSELTLNIPRDGEELIWAYDPTVFDAETVSTIAKQFNCILRNVTAEPDKPIGSISLLDEEQRRLVIEEWNNTQSDFAPVLMHEPFEEQAAKRPDSIALIFQDQELTYAELNARAEIVAAHLRKTGVKPDEPVGVCAEVSLEMMIGLLAVLKAGGAYLPLDPGFPKDRLAFMLEDSKARVLLTQTDLRDALPPTSAQILCIDSLLSQTSTTYDPAANGEANGHDKPQVHNLAYVIYTSGSTGKPKGVMITHGNVANFYSAMDRVLGTEPGVWLAVTSMSFDISVLELFWTLSRGFKVVLQPKAGAGSNRRRAAQPQAGRKLDFSLFYFAADEGAESSQKYRLLIEGAKFADEHGFEAIWTPERHFHSFGGLYPNPSVTSAAVAAVTQRIKIRAGSVVAPLHNPIRVAEEWSVVDNLSNGRVGISFASGWQVNDFVLAPENYAKRKERMLEYIDVIRRLWRGEKITRTVPNGAEVQVRILPRPVQQELPIWITASGSPETFKLAGELGANVLTHLLGQNLADLRKKIETYRAAWRDAGHAGAGKVTLMLHTFVHEDAEIAREAVRKPFTAYLRTSADLIRNDPWAFSTFKRPASIRPEDRDLKNAKLSEEELDAMAEHAFERYFETSGLFGTAAHCLELLRELQGIGVEEIGCLIDFGLPPEQVLTGLEKLAKLREQLGDGEQNSGARLSSAAATSASTEALEQSRPQPVKRVAAAQDSHAPGTLNGESESDYSIPAQILRHQVTHLQCTPSLATMLLEDSRALNSLRSLRKLLLGGEALPLSLVQKLDIPGDILNMYGPTETTIWSAVHRLDRSERIVPIGRPIANTQFYIVDKELRPLPIGIPGELLIGGAGVVRGYLGRPELTAERFVRKPFAAGGGSENQNLEQALNETGETFGVHPLGCSEPEPTTLSQDSEHPKGWTPNPSIQRERLYRTGDLARYLPDGRVEFLGRLDHQVKLRGYRIELGEIEGALQGHSSVKDCVAIVREDVPGDKRLVSYIITRSNEAVDSRELRKFLASRLPDYMVPSSFVPIAAFPLTPNGKLDRKALPAPDSASEPAKPEETTSNPTEAKIAEVMCGVLGIKKIGVRDDFFELGGNSLLATQLIARLRETFRWELPLRLAFEFPTVESLARAISEKSVAKAELQPEREKAVHAAAESKGAALSFAQQRIWFLHQLEPGPHYNDHFDLRIRGRLDAPVLEKALTEIIRRHQTLRSTFRNNDGQPQLVIAGGLHFNLPIVDLRRDPLKTREAEARRLAIEDCQKPFDLENGPLLRATLVRITSEDHLLILTFDHIVIDGWSHGVFLSELTSLYQAFLEERPSPLPDLAMQYADYASWQVRQFEEGAFNAHLDYWKRQLRDAPPFLLLPTDFPRPPAQSFRGAREFFRLDRELMEKVAAVARKERCTAYMALLGAFQILLARRSRQTDLVIGSPVANRGRADVEPLIGSFMNTLALRTDLAGNPSFGELLARVRQVVLDALAHQELPFEKLVAELQPARALGYGPVVQVMFILQNTPTPVSKARDVSFRHFDIDGGSSKLDLTLNLEETEDGADGWFEYATDLFKPETIHAMVEEYVRLLEMICADPRQKIEPLDAGLDLSAKTAAQIGTSPRKPEFIPANDARAKTAVGYHSNGNGSKHGPAPTEPASSLPQIQGQLAAIWSAVLGVKSVGLDDDLFDLGGHSLLVTQIISRIKKTWGVDVPIHHFFEEPTVAVISGLIERELGKTLVR